MKKLSGDPANVYCSMNSGKAIKTTANSKRALRE